MIFTGASPDECWPLVRDFHYSRKLPSATRHCFAWRLPGGLLGDTGEPIAAVMFGNPVNRNWPDGVLELQRLVRNPKLKAPLTKLISQSTRFIKKNTMTRFIISYADWGEGHHGGVYQAAGFNFVAISKARQDGIINRDGQFIHGRQVGRIFGTQKRAVVKDRLLPGWSLAYHDIKYLYIFPLRQRLNSILREFDWEILPYPKPNAACPSDAPVPTGVSQEHPLEAAP